MILKAKIVATLGGVGTRGISRKVLRVLVMLCSLIWVLVLYKYSVFLNCKYVILTLFSLYIEKVKEEKQIYELMGNLIYRPQQNYL